jgi:hypothetical protein
VGLDGQSLFGGGAAHVVEAAVDPGGDDGVFDEGVGADDVDGFVALGGGQFVEGHPDEHEGGGGVFAATVADDPGDGVGAVELGDFGDEGVDRGAEAVLGEGGGAGHGRLACISGGSNTIFRARFRCS